MGLIRACRALSFCFLCLAFSTSAQEINSYRILNLTINTSSPSDLRLNRGRLIWKELDGGGGHFLKYFSGAEIVPLDTAADFSHAIDGDYIVWNMPSSVVKSFNVRTWQTQTVASDAYYPTRLQLISVSDGFAAFAAYKAITGSEIRRRNLAASTDTIFSANTWNREPSTSFRQVAWSASASEDTAAASSIMLYDGRITRTVSDTNTVPNRKPILKDGGLVWLQYGSRPRVKAYIGDSLFTLAEANTQSLLKGYDISGGTAIAALTDTANTVSTIRIYRASSGTITVVTDSNLIQPPHIDNGQVVWVAGTGGGRVMKLYNVQSGLTDELGIADSPVIDDDHIAWTLGDAVMLRVPVTYEKLTSDVVNGWAQRRFKTTENGNILWGNFAHPTLPQSSNPRMFYSGGGAGVRLTDSVDYKDFEMVNSGYAIWRHDFNQLYVYDGVNPPVKVLDTLQVENMYIADSSIGFHGFGLNTGNSTNQAFIYRIATDTLVQLTNDPEPNDTSNFTTLVDGDDAVWYRTEKQDEMLMYYDGLTKTRLTDSLAGFRFSFVNGIIAWSERRNGVYQIMMKNVAGGGTVQLTNGTQDAMSPVTDGAAIAWFESASPTPILVYYEIATARKTKVARFTPSNIHWYWMSNGRIAWSSGNEARVFDGSSITQLTGSGDFTPNVEVYVDNEAMVWKQQANNPGIPALGDIFRGKLRPFAAFDAANIAGPAPLAVTFKNRSWQGARSYLWDFGDGGTSTLADPVHSYSSPGKYSVTLTVTGLTGQSVEKKWKLVQASAVTGVTPEVGGVPETFALKQNYPNPFNGISNFELSIAPARRSSNGSDEGVGGNLVNVELKIYDLLGREIATLVNEVRNPGVYQVQWNTGSLPSGVYFARLQAGGFREVRKVVLMK